MKKLNKIALGLATLVMGLGGNAMAAEQTGTAQVNASILPSCKIELPKVISVPIYTTKETGHSGPLLITCTKTTNYEIGLSAGASGSELTRVLESGANRLNYKMNVRGSGKTVWGDIGSENSYMGVGTGVLAFVMYDLKIPAGQYVAAGTYADNLVITFNY